MSSNTRRAAPLFPTASVRRGPSWPSHFSPHSPSSPQKHDRTSPHQLTQGKREDREAFEKSPSPTATHPLTRPLVRWDILDSRIVRQQLEPSAKSDKKDEPGQSTRALARTLSSLGTRICLAHQTFLPAILSRPQDHQIGRPFCPTTHNSALHPSTHAHTTLCSPATPAHHSQQA